MMSFVNDGGQARPEIVTLNEAEYKQAVNASLQRLGLTYEALRAQAAQRNFTSAEAHTLWIAIGSQRYDQ